MDLSKIAARVAGDGPGMEAVQMGVTFPKGMPRDEVLRRVRELIPCETGGWEDVDWEDGLAVGLLDCEEGFYEAAGRSSAYGPDDAGVAVEWEKP